ncbi:hypothetical protein [Campylobacter canadensis]|uniref:Uncharacterized protein n=1 Tax=Campylobacter canadensis TaxID=449520 RepID=A0ABS7WSG5_9BACT|nr:hypothetical protein [Campylobacter canadensis]MBZ7987708.1 hypothetical protein [Campylobacter canadensis]MBZ7994115.1 hypothetical protein [Campylobacter canadensis]MBZ7997519.1 hypothetical protein [Campylobacter canadensis]MBZ7999446.1 hypothetical protein [Campylobacter canadensis]MBZ8001243.1 hypothetical protein [Campylobacter canadensis]
MKNDENLNEELMYELALIHKAMLFYAGVKKDCLEKAAFAYMDLIDEIDCEDDFEAVLKTVKKLKEKHPEFF